MPNYLLLITVVILTNFSISSQQSSKEMDMVENTSIKVKNSRNIFYSLGPPEELRRAFGKTTIIKSADEVLEGYAYVHNYNGLEVYFNENKFEAITITKPEFQVLINRKIYKLGDQIQILEEDFSNSFKNRAWTNDIGMIHVGITHKKTVTDAFVVFTYNSKGIIIEIWIGHNNS